METEKPTLTGHPCFSAHAASRHSRVHLPIAKECNIQCKYCNRKYDCVNESRPGVTSAILSPGQALAYLGLYVEKHGVPDVIAIAGPGEAFADPETTLETFRLVKNVYPEVLLCVATNGLDTAKYVEDLASIGVSHCTITVNSFDPEIAARLYSWVRFNKRVYRGIEGALCIISQQRDSVKRCKKHGVTVKINTIVVPGVNEGDIENTALECAALGASVMNCMPLLPVAGSEFERYAKPDHEMMQKVRWNSANHIPIVSHCARCRADAAGIIGHDNPLENAKLLAMAQQAPLDGNKRRTRIAVATREGVLVNQHLGAAKELEVYSRMNGTISLHSRRTAPASGGGSDRWRELAETISDCRALLVYRAGTAPRNVFEKEGIQLYETQGFIEELLEMVFEGKTPPEHPTVLPCGNGCGGNGGGCG